MISMSLQLQDRETVRVWRSPRGPLTTYFNDEEGGGGGRESDRGSYFIPIKITTSEFVYPKKSLLFLVYPKKSLSPCFASQKNPSVFFFATQKNSGVFYRPKKITFGQNFRPKKTTQTPPSLEYVSGAPGGAVVRSLPPNPEFPSSIPGLVEG